MTTVFLRHQEQDLAKALRLSKNDLAGGSIEEGSSAPQLQLPSVLVFSSHVSLVHFNFHKLPSIDDRRQTIKII